MTADHEVSAKTSAEELKTLAEATQVLQSETCGADGQMYSLFQENPNAALQTSTDLKGFDMMTAVRQLAEQEHSTALAQLRSRTSAITKFGADADNDPFVKMKDLITDFSRSQADASPETSQKSHCAEEASKAAETKEDLGAQVAKHSSELLVEVRETVSKDRAQQRTVEQIVDAPVPQAVEELPMEVYKDEKRTTTDTLPSRIQKRPRPQAETEPYSVRSEQIQCSRASRFPRRSPAADCGADR